jgi:kinesin family protein 11
VQAANKHNSNIQVATRSVHDETVRIVDAQMKDIETQMKALDDFVTRARLQNAQHHGSHTASFEGLSATVKSSYSNIGSHFTSTFERVRDLGDEMSAQTTLLQQSLDPLDSILRRPLAQLRENISRTVIQEYKPTGATPQKIQYQYPTELPRTEDHESLLAALRRPSSPSKQTTMVPVVFNDTPKEEASISSFHERGRRPTGGLSTSGGETQKENNALPQIPSFKRSMSGKLPLAVQRSGGKRNTVAAAPDGRENVALAPAAFSQSVGVGGRRRSPRTGGS